MSDGEMRYYLGLDNGGTTTKAALFDRCGRQVASASVLTAMLMPAPGFVERDMEEMWRANCTVIREALAKARVKAEEIAGVGICGHGKGLYLWGKDGRPVRNGIISTDNRAYRYPLQWAADGTAGKVREISCQQILSCQPPALLAWLKEHEPENYERIAWVFSCKDYVRFRLTGEARGEMTDSSGSNLLNLRTKDYDPRLLELFGIPEMAGALPPLCESLEIAGRVTEEAAGECGLRAGTPVIGGMFDIDACAIGVGVLDPDTVCMIAGTWSINEYIRKDPVTDGTVAMNSIFALPGYYLVEESSPTSAGNHQWFLRELLPEVQAQARAEGRSVYEVMNAWVESVPAERFVPVFLPFLMASNVHPNAKGTFVGIHVGHSRKDLLRSVYEGIAFSHRYHMERLLTSREKAPVCVRLAGGAARSEVWTQMFADVLQLPVETVTAEETGALGCAIGAAAAAGEYAQIREAAEAMVSVGRRVLPDPGKKEIYDRKYRLYLRAIECLDPLWDEMQRMEEGER